MPGDIEISTASAATRLRVIDELAAAAGRAYGADVAAMTEVEYLQAMLICAADRIAAGEVRGFMRRVPAADKAPLITGIE
jgi:hypothetical protein